VSASGQKTKMCEANLRDSHSAAELFINSVPSILIGIDAQGLVNRWNRAAAQTFSLEETEVLGKPLSNCGIHWLSSGIESTISDLLGSPRKFVWDGVQFEKNGEPHILGMTVNCVQISNSERGELLIVGSDISLRKRTEDELRAKTAFFEAQIQATIDGLLVVDENGNILLHNERFGEIFEIPSQLFKNSDDNPVLDHVVGKVEDPSRFVERVKYLYAHRQERSRDEIKLLDGRVLDRFSSPVFGSDGHYYGRIWTFRDITEPKKAEDELRAKTAFLEALIQASIDGVLVVNGTGNVVWRNQRFLRLCEIPESLSGSQSDDALLRSVLENIEDPQFFLERVRHLYVHTHETSRDEIRHRNGRVFDRYSSPVFGQDGHYYGRIWTFRDITERKRNEDALRQLSVAVEQSPVSVVITDLGGNITYVNRRFTECTGYSYEEVIGQNPRLLKSGHTSPGEYRQLWETITRGEEWHGELHNKKKNGDLYWESAVIAPIRSNDGQISHFLAVKEDITRRKQAENDLRLAKFALENASDSVLWVDPQARILYANQAACRVLGHSRQELNCMSITDIDPSIPKGKWRGFWEELKTRGSMTFESQPRNEEGQAVTIEVMATHFEFGGQEYLLSFARDITKRRRAENELRLTKSSLENASVSVFWVDPQGHILYVNQAACQALGFSHEELTSLSVPDIDPLFHREKWQSFWQELKMRGSMTLESQQRHKDGRILPTEISANYLEFDGQEYLFAFTRDISERRMIQAQLQQAQKMESVGQLAAGIAHEINTPIQFVGDNLRFIKDSWSGPESLISLCESLHDNAIAADALQQMRRILKESDSAYLRAEIPRALDQSLDGIDRVAKIVRAMKEFSHPGSEEKQAADINQAILTTLTVSRNEWKYVAEVETLLQPEMQLVPCHIGELNQVFLNLLVNSAHAIEEVVGEGSEKKGKITIQTAQDAQFTTITVRDTGAGIRPELQSRIFDPFFTTKGVGRGTGQGLFLAHNSIVKKHGGKIWFDSEIGKGTTFSIQLPTAGTADTHV
jgi:two-component system, NtrC family, sensor kinase